MSEQITVTKHIREGNYLLEIDLIGERGSPDDPWAPLFSPEEAQKLYEAKKVLKEQDLEKARRLGRLFEVQPV